MKKYLLFFISLLPALVYSQQLYRGGVVPQDLSKIDWIKKVQPSAHTLGKALSPASVDNSAHIPPVLNQGGQNSCLAFALGYYYKTYEGWQLNNAVDVTDPANQYSPTFLYNLINGGGNNPSYTSDAGQVLIDHGIATMSDCPFTEGDIVTWPTEAQFTNALQTRWSAMYSVDVSTDAGVTAVKDHIAAGNVAVLIINIYPNLNAVASYGNNYAVANKSGSSSGAHAVTIVGYDDAHVWAGETGAFRCVNSWGTGWGDAGYFWMSYTAVKDYELSQQQVIYGEPRTGYTPSIIAKFKVTHNSRRSLDFTVGVGTYSSTALYNRPFMNFINNSVPGSVDRPMPNNNIVLDLTDLSYQFKNAASNNFYFAVQDNRSDAITGTIDHVDITVPVLSASATAAGLPLGIADNGSAAVVDQTINSAVGSTLALTNPQASGATLKGNTPTAITWTSSGVTNVKLEYSTNAGAAWTTIAASVASGAGSYAWTTPNITNTGMIVKISDVDEPLFSDANVVNVWRPVTTAGTYTGGAYHDPSLAFPQGKFDSYFENGGSYTIVYYPYEAPIAGALPAGILSVGNFYWTVSTTTPCLDAWIYFKKAELRSDLNFSNARILARSAPGDAWVDYGRGSNATYIYSTIGGAFDGFVELTMGTTDGSTPLPVELASFTAHAGERSITLNWKTATEINTHGFEIERNTASPAVKNGTWEKIGFIKGSGMTNAPKEYAYTDAHLGSLHNRYRLKMIDNDGAFSYSQVVEATAAVPTEYALSQNYPNPFNPSTKIDYTLPASGDVRLQIFTVTGQLAATLVDAHQDAGYYSVTCAAQRLSSGMYFYRLSVNGRSIVKKMLLMR